MRSLGRLTVALVLALVLTPGTEAEQAQRITVLYDAFGPASDLEKDWGFAALVEYGGKRILFDTGNNAGIFARNAKKLGVDLTRLDAAVISHRHGDHTTGLSHLIELNPKVAIWTPSEGAFFKSVAPPEFLAPQQPDLPRHLRYFDGAAPPRLVSGTPWEAGNFAVVTKTTEIVPGFFAITTTSKKPGTLEMNEVSLVIRTPQGLVVVVGCAHPGVEVILAEAAKIDPVLYAVTGGFHLVMTSRAEVERVAAILHDDLKVQRVAPGHCTSELGFAILRDRFKDRFDHAGVGTVIALP
jgi:7,8-dihydropterin-6-yl-methyl-4-(beta-D-ribofuranosyl)aminobenzene 5'-phosphate synthase